MSDQDLALLNNQRVRIICVFLPQRTKKFVRISKKFELSGKFCQELTADTHGTKNLFQLMKVIYSNGY